MRLGAWPCVLKPGVSRQQAYGATEISERHRHRFEFNREFEETLTSHGLANYRRDAERDLRGNLRDRGPSVLSGLPVPSGIQVEAAGAASAVPVVCGRGLQVSGHRLAGRDGPAAAGSGILSLTSA